MVWYSHLFQNFPQFIVIHTVKGFGIVNKAEIDVFMELSCFFNDPADFGNLISGSSAFSKTNLDSILKKQRHYFANKDPSSQVYGFSSSHVWMWELEYKENWEPKNGCFWTAVLEKTLESPLDCKGIQPLNPQGNQSWIFIGRTDAEAEAPMFCGLILYLFI